MKYILLLVFNFVGIRHVSNNMIMKLGSISINPPQQIDTNLNVSQVFLVQQEYISTSTMC